MVNESNIQFFFQDGFIRADVAGKMTVAMNGKTKLLRKV